MLRTFEPVGQTHLKEVRKYTQASAAEQARKTFPMPMPSTHRLSYRWLDPMTLEIWPEEYPNLAENLKAIPVVVDPHAPTGDVVALPLNAVTPPPPKVDLHADARAKLMVELQTYDRNSLETKAAETNVKFSKKDSTEQLIAKIVDKLVPVKDAK